MAQLPGGQFDHSQYQDMRDFSPVPPGKYIAKVMSSELKDTSTGGQMLVLNFEIAAGRYMGKSFITRLNVTNASPAAVKIANEELATLTRACNLGPITNSDQLHGIAHVATLKLIPAEGTYGPKNEPAKYETAQGLTEPPVNPEPDEATLAIMAGTATAPAQTVAPTAAGAVPDAPAGFAGQQAAPAAPNAAADTGTQQQAPAAPAAPLAPAAPAAAPATQAAAAPVAAASPSEAPAAPAAPNGGGVAASDGKPPW